MSKSFDSGRAIEFIKAVIDGDISVASALLARNPEYVNYPYIVGDEEGVYPLNLAIRSYPKDLGEMAKILISNGADPYLATAKNSDLPIMHFCALNGHKSIYKTLRGCKDIDIVTSYEFRGEEIQATPIEMAMIGLAIEIEPKKQEKYRYIIGDLIEKGAELNNSPLLTHIAYEIDDNQIMRRLLINGADLNLQDGKGLTLAHKMAMDRVLDHYQALLNNGLDPTIEDNQGKTAIDYANSKSDVDLLKSYGGMGSFLRQAYPQDKTMRMSEL